MEKITNIKQKLLENKLFILLDNVKQDNLDYIAAYISKKPCAVIFLARNSDDKTSIKFLFQLRQICSLFNSLLFVLERADFSKITDCDGIVLDKNSITLKQAKTILDNDKIFCYLAKNSDNIDTEEGFDLIIDENKIIKEGT